MKLSHVFTLHQMIHSNTTICNCINYGIIREFSLLMYSHGRKESCFSWLISWFLYHGHRLLQLSFTFSLTSRKLRAQFLVTIHTLQDGMLWAPILLLSTNSLPSFSPCPDSFNCLLFWLYMLMWLGTFTE